MTAAAPPDADAITVRRCTVTVVRRGGWSWGPDPKGLVDQALAALPELLADHFAEHLAGEGPDAEITEPVVLTVRHRPGPRTAFGNAPPPFELQDAPLPEAHPAPGPAGGAPPLFEEALTAAGRPWAPPPAAALFHELAERGELDALLALLPDDSLRVYLRALLSAADPTAPRLLTELERRAPADRRPGPAPGRPGEPGTTARQAPAPTAADAADGEFAADSSPNAARDASAAAPPSTALPPADHIAPAPSGPLPDPAAAPAAALSTAPVRRRTGPDGASPPRTTGEAHISCVLPFLLAGPLARIGHLDAIGPALDGVELAEEAPLFAAALAYKVLGPTRRGWRRTAEDSEAAAVFAGLEPPVPEERLARFAGLVRPALPVLDAVLALAVCRGHDPADPLLLTGADGRLLLVDAQGMFPVAWAEEAAELLPHWHSSGRPPVLVCDGPLPPGTLPELAAAGVRFTTAVRPLRGDPVTRLPGRTPLWGARGAPRDPRTAAALPACAERLSGLVRALVAERRSVPRAEDGALDRSVTLAAALGLSTIAWTLWRTRETPDPLAALERFADLDATVRFGPETVRVRVPLGRRHADLLRAGLLADVPDVVWLGGRTLTFSGG